MSVSGPKILFTIPILGGLPITETIVNCLIISAVIMLLVFILTYKMDIVPTKRQVIAEKFVNTVYSMVEETMGKGGLKYAPYIGTLFIFSCCCSLSSLFGLRPPTGDLNTTAAWAIVTFILIEKNKIKSSGILGYLKGFTTPIFIMTPLNIVSEFATPVSLAFRHFGNIVAGIVITELEYTALAGITNSFSKIPFFQVGIPAFLSLYFDLFTSVMQAFIFCMLTMAFVASASEE